MAARGRPRGAAAIARARAVAAADAADAADAAVPAVPAIPAPARLPALTALERAFVGIGFTVDGARQLCLDDGENVTLDALPYISDKVEERSCRHVQRWRCTSRAIWLVIINVQIVP